MGIRTKREQKKIPSLGPLGKARKLTSEEIAADEELGRQLELAEAVARAELLQQLTELSNSLVTSGDSAAFHGLRHYSRSGKLPKGFSLPFTWNMLVVEFLEHPDPEDFIDMKWDQSVPKVHTATKMHAVIQHGNVEEAGYIIAQFDNFDDGLKVDRFVERVGFHEAGVLLFHLRAMLASYRDDPTRFQRRHRR